MRTFKLLCIFLLISFKGVFAQNPLFRHYTTNDGLPSSTVFPMIQDKDGFIWFGTDVGVTRFDGKKFQNFTLTDGLSDNYILNVKTDSKGRTWFLGLNGTVSYWLNGKIYNAGSDTLLRNITSNNSFVDLFEDNQNRIWFIAQYEYIILDNNKIIQSEPKHSHAASIVINGKSGQIILRPGPPFFMKYVFQNLYTFNLHYKVKPANGYLRFQDGSILFISNEGVIRQSDTIQKLIIPFHGEFNNLRLGSMTLSSDSLLWITVMGKGLYCYNLKNPTGKPKIYLKNKLSAGVLADREGNIWISTLNEGLYMIPFLGEKVILFNKENGLPDNQCYAINKRNTGELLVALNNGKVQVISNTITSEIKKPERDITDNMVHRIISRNDDVWIAHECGLIHQNAKTGCNHFVNQVDLSNSQFRKLANVKDITLGETKIYIACGSNILEYPATCSGNSGYLAINIKEKIIRNYSIFIDHSSQLWYGTIEGLHSKKESSFLDHSKEDVLLSKRINSIAQTEDSVLVLATHGFGILLYKNGKIITHITAASGLANDICRKVFVHKNRIYVSTPGGVSILYYSTGKVLSIQNMNTGNFLPSNDVNDVYADDKDISVATMEGVAVIGQWALGKTEPAIPLLHITEIGVNDSIIAPEGEAIFPYTKNSFKFNFIGIYYQQPNEVNYRYRLKTNQPWQTTKNTELEFSFLPPGNYIFQLQARILDGNWSNLKSFKFTIMPPFWKTIWFITLIIIGLGFLAYHLVKRRLKTIRNQEYEKAKIVKQITELEQQALQTMMNPHFIFNVMNSIQHFINANDKEAANRYLADFATLIRMNLTISYKRFIPLEEEIDYLELYMSFEKLRFGDKLTHEIIVDDTIDKSETIVVVMMIQPFIENAIWHGILPMNAKGHITVRIKKEAEDLLKIMVEDNGVGIPAEYIVGEFLEQGIGSHALSMTLQRLKLLGKSSPHKLYIQYKYAHPEHENKGTIVELLLPATFH